MPSRYIDVDFEVISGPRGKVRWGPFLFWCYMTGSSMFMVHQRPDLAVAAVWSMACAWPMAVCWKAFRRTLQQPE